jgi:1-phosphofructokinase/tagatose 6-phosphate kinase
MSFLTVCLNPVLQKTLCFSSIIPDTVNRTPIHRLDASGKGINVTRVLHQLGKNVTHLTQLGGLMRPLFLSLCRADSLAVEWVESGSPIRFCYTLVSAADSTVTELVEEAEPAAAGTEELLLKKFRTLLPLHDFIVISGTKARGFSDKIIPALVQLAKEKGLKIILDLKGKDLTESLQYYPDIIKPNLFEFASTFAPELIKHNDLSGDDPETKKRISAAALELCKKYRCGIILTRGSNPLWAAEPSPGGGSFFELPVQTVKPVNTTGCGDAFTAGLAAALENGAAFAAAIAEGTRCGALNAGFLKPGVIKE